MNTFYKIAIVGRRGVAGDSWHSAEPDPEAPGGFRTLCGRRPNDFLPGEPTAGEPTCPVCLAAFRSRTRDGNP